MGRLSDTVKRHWSWAVTLILFSSLGMIYAFVPAFREFVHEGWDVLRSGNRPRISDWFESLGIIGPLMIIISMVLQMFLLVLPSWSLMIVSVIAYGPVLGAVLSIIAVAAAATAGYFIGRLFSGLLKKNTDRRKENRVRKFIERYGFGAVFLFRLSPLLSNDAISIASGVLRMRYDRFMLATIGGITPLTIAIAWLGSEADRLKTGLYWLGGVSIVLYVVFIVIDRRNR